MCINEAAVSMGGLSPQAVTGVEGSKARVWQPGWQRVKASGLSDVN